MNIFVQNEKVMRGIFLSGITFIFLLVSCNRSVKSGAENHAYTIATLKGPSSMGMIFMIDSLSKSESGKIKAVIEDEPIQVRKMMLEGTADFAVLPATMAAILYNKGLDYKLIAIPVWGTLYLFGNDTTIGSWQDLKGRTVHVMAKGMTPDVLFRNLLQGNGIIPDAEVSLDYSFPTHIELANAVAAGRAELAVISEPMVSLVMKNSTKGKPILDLNLEWEKLQGMPMAQTAFLVKEALTNEHPQLVEQILTAYENSTRRVNEDPHTAAALIVRYDILPDSLVALQSIPRSNLRFVRANRIETEIQEYLKVFYEMNPEIIGGKLPDENFIH
jgi:NitT/TauT family transport system substrate-binding protein